MMETLTNVSPWTEFDFESSELDRPIKGRIYKAPGDKQLIAFSDNKEDFIDEQVWGASVKYEGQRFLAIASVGDSTIISGSAGLIELPKGSEKEGSDEVILEKREQKVNDTQGSNPYIGKDADSNVQIESLGERGSEKTGEFQPYGAESGWLGFIRVKLPALLRDFLDFVVSTVSGALDFVFGEGSLNKLMMVFLALLVILVLK